ncbi:MAG TPA: serine acetyltransferase [Burkholderiales bacterium]|nr:serine acetyltransferase [Burkholderiales bacterium]
MEDRGYVAEALLERLRSEAIEFRLLDDVASLPERAPEELPLAVPAHLLPAIPRHMARFAQDFDLRLVELYRPAWAAWRAVLAWTDEIGRPRFMAARFFVAIEQGESAAELFICGLADALHKGTLGEDRARWLSELWREAPQDAAECLARRWREGDQQRLIANAARSGNWQAVRARLGELRRALGRFRVPRLPRRAPSVLFAGRDSPTRTNLMVHVQGRLAPLGLEMFEQLAGASRRGGFRVVCDGPGELHAVDTVVVGPGQPFGAMVSQVERAVLRWLECRVERRYPDAVVGPNPLAARLLQTPGIGRALGWLLNCRLDCRLRSPLLMPVPMGIVIERGVELGSRVTVMHHVTIGRKDPVAPLGQGGKLAVIEDNVFIGAGAKVLGPVRIGRGAIVGANAVVTRDVPSYCTVVGANRILGIETPAVAAARREEAATLS